MKPIDASYWAGLTEKQKWDSIVGLRGPDLGPSSTIKWFTTSVIRARLSGVMRVGGQVNPDLNAVVVPYGSIFPPKTAIYPGPGGKIWKNDLTSISCEHGKGCEVCAALIKELDWYRALPFWDYTHWNCHTQEAAHELQIPIYQVDGRRWWEMLSGRGLKASTEKLIAYFSDERSANPEAVRELSRHLEVLQAGQIGGW